MEEELQFGTIPTEDGSKFKTPRVSIGGVDIHQQAFSWALTAGVFPYQTSFIVNDSNLSQKLLSIKNPTFIEIEAYGGCDGEPKPIKKKFEKVYLLEPTQTDPFHVRWDIADSRYALRGKKIFGFYNKTRVQNKKGISVVVPDDGTRPEILREQFDTFRVGRYIPWSIKKDGKAWTVYEIIVDILKQNRIAVRDTSTGQRGAYILENIELVGRDLYSGLAYLLALSRLQMGINIDGSLYIYSLDWFDETELNLTKKFEKIPRVSPGVFFKQDLRKERPKGVLVYFEKKTEVWVIGSSSDPTATFDANSDRPKLKDPDGRKTLPVTLINGIRTMKDIEGRRVMGCENVLPVPYPIDIDGETKNVGEWVPVWKYLNALGIPDAEFRAVFFQGKMIRWFSQKMGLESNDTEERRLHHIVSVIKQHYRQTWQIDPLFMDRIDHWEPRRVSVINNMDHYTAPSPVYADMCYVPAFRQPKLAKRTGLWNENAYNWILGIDDPYRIKPTGATINMIDQALGIFSIQLPPTLEMIVRTFPFALNPLPYPSLSSSTHLLDECQVIKEHNFETIISVTWAVDEMDDMAANKYRIFYFPLKGGEGPKVTVLSDAEYARYGINFFPLQSIGNIGEGDPGGGAVLSSQEAVNEGIITAMANVEAARIANSYRDRFSGICAFAGFVETQLVGTVKGIIYSFTPSSGLTTTVDARDIPPPPTFEQSLKQKDIDYLRRHIKRGDNASEIGK